jgi:hypothetical protein
VPLSFLEPSGATQACNGTALPFFLPSAAGGGQRNCVVGVAACYVLKGWGFETRHEKEISSVPHPPRPTLATTQPLAQWTSYLFSRQSGWRVALNPEPSTEGKNEYSYTSSSFLSLHGKIWGSFHQEQYILETG